MPQRAVATVGKSHGAITAGEATVANAGSKYLKHGDWVMVLQAAARTKPMAVAAEREMKRGAKIQGQVHPNGKMLRWPGYCWSPGCGKQQAICVIALMHSLGFELQGYRPHACMQALGLQEQCGRIVGVGEDHSMSVSTANIAVLRCVIVPESLRLE